MKLTVKQTFFFLTLVTVVFSSCGSLTMMHYKRTEFDKVNDKLDTYTVYIIDPNSTYQIDKPKLTATGIKGDLTEIRDPKIIAEIKNPHTHKQLRKHKHDLDLYTKTTINDNASGTLLKNVDISEVVHLESKTKPSIGEDVATGFVLALGVAVIVGVVYSFQGGL